MNAITPRQAPQKPTGWLPGMSYYTVMKPSAILDPAGNPQYEGYGPFGTLFEAEAASRSMPGALIAVTLMLHMQSPAGATPPPPVAKAKGST